MKKLWLKPTTVAWTLVLWSKDYGLEYVQKSRAIADLAKGFKAGWGWWWNRGKPNSKLL